MPGVRSSMNQAMRLAAAIAIVLAVIVVSPSIAMRADESSDQVRLKDIEAEIRDEKCALHRELAAELTWMTKCGSIAVESRTVKMPNGPPARIIFLESVQSPHLRYLSQLAPKSSIAVLQIDNKIQDFVPCYSGGRMWTTQFAIADIDGDGFDDLGLEGWNTGHLNCALQDNRWVCAYRPTESGFVPMLRQPFGPIGLSAKVHCADTRLRTSIVVAGNPRAFNLVRVIVSVRNVSGESVAPLGASLIIPVASAAQPSANESDAIDAAMLRSAYVLDELVVRSSKCADALKPGQEAVLETLIRLGNPSDDVKFEYRVQTRP